MYRQIQVSPEDRHLQKIVWRYDTAKEAKDYELNTMTYGLSCAPFLAMKTLQQLTIDEGDKYPLGAVALRQDTYMDDVLTGAFSLQEAKELQIQLTELCRVGGFPLRKWSTNHDGVLQRVPADHKLQHDSRSWQPHESHATLGLQWHPSVDAFLFTIPAVEIPTATKQTVLLLTARLFDPLGWLAPVVVRAKILFQSTWLMGVDWDTPLDERHSLF